MANNKLTMKYLLGIAMMLLFVVADIVFDFLFNFEGSDSISFACTLVAAITVFYGSYSIKKKHITTEFENATAFIKSNFDNWQVAFSVLDIICGAISILSGIAFLSAIFKFVKIGYIPLKVAVVTNKGKSVVKAVSKVGLLWTSGRLLSEDGKQNNNKEKNNMFKKIGAALKTCGLWIYSNKISILGTIGAIISGIIAGMAAHTDILVYLPELYVFGIDIVPYAAGVAIFGLTELGVTGRGFEAIKTFLAIQAQNKADRNAAKAQAELDKKADKYLKEQEAKKKEEEKKIALEKAKQEQELKKQQEEAAKAEADKKAAEEKAAEEVKIIARAMELKAEAEKKAAEQQQK